MTSRRWFLRTLSAAGLSGIVPSTGLGDDAARVAGRGGLNASSVARGGPDYEIWRQSMVWHLSKPARYPDLIVQAHSEQDVRAAVNYAREQGLKITVRGGGHSSCGVSLRDGGVLINLAAMREAVIDRDARMAAVQPAIGGRDFARLLEKQGLAFPVAHCGMVSLSGYLLGGGMGWNGETWGQIACLSVVAADVVTANGKMLTVNAEQHADLYWALRGAGPGFFGVVTRYYLKLYPLPRAIVASSYVHPLGATDELAATLEELMRDGRANVEAYLFLMHDDETEGSAGTVCAVRVVTYAESQAQAAAMLAPFAASRLGRDVIRKNEARTSSFEALMAPDNVASTLARTVADNLWTDSPGAAATELSRYFAERPSTEAHALVSFSAGRPLVQDAAFSKIGAGYIVCDLEWHDVSHDAENRDWLHGATARMRPFKRGHYINEMDHVSNPQNVPQAFSASAWERLEQLRDKYDPTRVFHSYFGYDT